MLPFEGVDEREASSGWTLDRETLAASKAANSSCAAVVILFRCAQHKIGAFVDIRTCNSVVLGSAAVAGGVARVAAAIG